MKFMNSASKKGYANFAAAGYYAKKKAAAANAESDAVRARAMERQGRVPGGSSFGPQPMQGPQQKKGKVSEGLTKAKNAVEGKAQYYGAKAKNTLAKAGSFIKNNKVGVGLAAAGALGAAGAGIAMARKMRADKGRKRGKYSK